jgi:hypothetical protein
MKNELKKIKALIDSHEELIDGSIVYADIDIWSEAKKAYDSIVKESDSLPCVSDFAELLLNQGNDLYEKAKQARSEKEEALLSGESMAYKRIGKELMAHCR